MIFTGFQPNATKQDLKTALGFLLLPWKWLQLRKGNAIQKVEDWMKNYFNVEHAVTFDSGRTALQKALEVLDVQKDDEVLVQAYTCVVVSNSIKWAGGTPIYVDVQDDYNMNPEDLNNKITHKSKVLIIQHTFGKPADLKQLLAIAKAHNLKVIEDCAHSLGVKHTGQLTGTFGDIGMFSFGTDKVVSSIRGGALITKDNKLGTAIHALHDKLPLSRRLKVIQYLLNIPAFSLGKPLYGFGIGKYILGTLVKCNITGRILYKNEIQGKPMSFYPSQFSNALARMLLDQFKTLDAVNQHRQDIAMIYRDNIQNKTTLSKHTYESIYLRFTIQVDKPARVQAYAKKQGIMLGDWYNEVIAPRGCSLVAAGYKKGTCPNAEKLAQHSLNLPTNRHITQKDALKIADVINKIL